MPRQDTQLRVKREKLKLCAFNIFLTNINHSLARSLLVCVIRRSVCVQFFSLHRLCSKTKYNKQKEDSQTHCTLKVRVHRVVRELCLYVVCAELSSVSEQANHIA